MKTRFAIAVLLTLLLPALGHSEPGALRFVQKIGVDWHPGRSGSGWMGFVAFSADGTMVASDGPSADDASDGLSLWSFPEGRLIKKLSLAPESLSKDWKYVAGSHGVVDVETGRPLISLPENEYADFVFSPDSRYVAQAPVTRRGTRIRIFELPAGKQVSAFAKHYVSSMAISPDGQTLASGHWNVVKLWNLVSGKRNGILRGFGRYVQGLAFSPDGNLLAAGTDAGQVQIWDLRQQKKIQSFDLGGGEVSDPAFSPDGTLVAVGIYGTGTVYLLDVDHGSIVDQQKVSDLGCGSVAFSPDGRFLITPSTGGLITWPYDHGGTIRVFQIDVH